MLRRPAASALASASSALSGSRRSTCRALVTCSSIAARPCPTRSCTSRAMRRRSSACARAASSCRAASSSPLSRSCRCIPHPSTTEKAMPITHIPQAIRFPGGCRAKITTGLAASATQIAPSCHREDAQRAATTAASATRNNDGSRRPVSCATATGSSTPAASAGSGSAHRCQARNVSTATARISGRTHPAGSVTAASTATASATGDTRRCSMSGRRGVRVPAAISRITPPKIAGDLGSLVADARPGRPGRQSRAEIISGGCHDL